jgi:hypothetical protein
MRTLFLLLAVSLAVVTAQAQNIVPTRVIGNSKLTNALVVSAKPTKLFAVTGYSPTTQYIQIIQTNQVPTNGIVPVFSVPVSAGQFYSIDFSYYGADLDSVTVVNSSTQNTLTLGSANTTFQAIIRAN